MHVITGKKVTFWQHCSDLFDQFSFRSDLKEELKSAFLIKAIKMSQVSVSIEISQILNSFDNFLLCVDRYFLILYIYV